LAKSKITKSLAVKGDIGAIYDSIKQTLEKMNFKENASIWPSEIEFKRGKSGFLARNLKEVRTVLTVSLKQASDNVNMLFEYTFSVPSSFIDKSNNEIDEEFIKIRHELSGTVPGHDAGTQKICDVCLTPLKSTEKFCANCGRSANPQKIDSPNIQSEQDISFDPNKIAFGQKIVDDTLYGGLPPNSVVLITSPACEEKDLIITRFMETGLDQDETVVYVTTDCKMAQNQKAKDSQGFFQVICNPQAEISVGSSKNVDIKVKGVERLTELSVALTTLINNISKKNDVSKQKRLVIDILSDTLLSNQSVNTRKWLRETITKFKNKNFTILSILNPYMHSKEETHSLLDLFDGQIDLCEKELDGNSKIFMRVKRMNNARYSSKETELIREDLWLENKVTKT